MTKSSVAEIRARFDADVERFSNLETGQSATVDAALALELVAEAATATTPRARSVLDIGCGAGNYSLKLLARLPALDVTLIDLSRPMLDRAESRVRAAGAARVVAHQVDLRDAQFSQGTFDIVLAAAVLHHLRADDEWHAAFGNLYRWLKPGGAVWIFDLVDCGIPALAAATRARYGDYLTALGGADYREKVLAYIDREDSPKSLDYQLDLLKRVGFAGVEVLHKSGPFAAFGALKR